MYVVDALAATVNPSVIVREDPPIPHPILSCYLGSYTCRYHMPSSEHYALDDKPYNVYRGVTWIMMCLEQLWTLGIWGQIMVWGLSSVL